METKANYALVGAFTVAVVLAGLGLIAWFAQARGGQTYAEYQIIFSGSVTGLNEGSDVRYNGIRVGTVDTLRLNPRNPSEVEVRVRLYATTPVRTDSIASIGYQGFTGVAHVQISGGSANAPLLRVASKDPIPIIPSRRSGFEQIVAGAPDLMASATLLLQQITAFTNPENQQAFAGLLKNLNAISGSVAAHGPETEPVMANAGKISQQLAQTSEKMNVLADRLNRLADGANQALGATNELVNGDAAAFLREARLAAASYRQTGENLQALLTRNQNAIDSFSGEGLNQITRLAADTRQLVVTLDRLAQRFETEPARFLLGRPVPEYDPR